jgi:periplasmic protein TonB
MEVVMKTMLMTYGAFELRELYKKNITKALMIAGLLHMMIIGGYQMYSHLTGEKIEFTRIITITNTTIIPLPPPLEAKPAVPRVAVESTPLIQKGNLIPIPDNEINPDITLATQKELNETPLPGSEIGDPNGSLVVIDEGTVIDNSDEKEPPPFQIVEKDPIPVHQVYPPYPEIARRAGVEGTVNVKMWVTKDGKVRKVEIVKSASDLFNQVSLEAAEQWTFTPAIMNNGPVSVWVSVPFKFRLNAK